MQPLAKACFRKKMNLLYYVRQFGYNALPSYYFQKKYQRLKQYEKTIDPELINRRLDYYFKVNSEFTIPENAVAVGDYKRTGGSGYYFDLKEFLHYFKAHTRFAFHFGDDTHVNPYPTLFKARPVEGDNANSILFKLNKHRHFVWVNDDIPFERKKDRAVWRGAAYRAVRKDFVNHMWEHPMCDIGQTNSPAENVSWQKPPMSIKEQLQHKFIFSVEGNDVATNLKWVMSSNSLCFMPKPQYETWFMEGTLEPGVHYVEIKTPYDDVEEKIKYYLSHPEEAQVIIKNANEYVKQFQNQNLEDLLCIKVLERYAQLSKQSDFLRF